MKKESDLLQYDFEGWPVYRMTLREVIEELGVFNKNEETGKYEISIDNEYLDAYPRVSEDDGMGYGAMERWITSSNVYTSNEGEKCINIFAEVRDKNLYKD